MESPPNARRMVIAGLVCAGLAGATIGWSDGSTTEHEAPVANASEKLRVAAVPRFDSRPPSRRLEPDVGGGAVEPASDDVSFDDAFPPGDPAWAWAQVDLDALREQMPDNLYWTMAMPSRDPQTLRRRAEAREQTNVEYGKVLSNTATEAEVDTYFDGRHRQSDDYVMFIGRVLEDYSDVLPARDRKMLELARNLHQARLEGYPRERREAHQRRQAHAAAREAWLATKKDPK